MIQSFEQQLQNEVELTVSLNDPSFDEPVEHIDHFLSDRGADYYFQKANRFVGLAVPGLTF